VPGSYWMNADDRPKHEGFWRLEPNPPVRWWEYKLGIRRNGFMLHPGGRSKGCITADRRNGAAMQQYEWLVELLWSERGLNTLTVVP
jgi:hypothetical protein